MRILVITELLLLLRDADCDLYSLPDVADRSVKLEGPLRLLWHVVCLAHQVIDELVGQCVELDSSNHVYHFRDHLLTVRHVQLQGFAVLLSPIVVASCFAPLLLALVVLGDLEVLLSVSIIVLQDYFSVLIHLLMRLGNNKSVIALPAKDQELDCFLLCALSLTVLGDLESALRQLALLSENYLGPLSVIQKV